jgi:hypothetical protein
LFEVPPAAVLGQAFATNVARTAGGAALASPLRRILAALLDVALLSAVNAAVVYLTLRLLGLTASEISHLPLLPLLAFFLLLNGGLPLGAGFLPGVIRADRLALHDRLAHTRVVRPW